MRIEIEIEEGAVPAKYRPVRYGSPKDGESFMQPYGGGGPFIAKGDFYDATRMETRQYYLIVEKIETASQQGS